MSRIAAHEILRCSYSHAQKVGGGVTCLTIFGDCVFFPVGVAKLSSTCSEKALWPSTTVSPHSFIYSDYLIMSFILRLSQT